MKIWRDMVYLKKGIEYLDIYWDFANTFNPLSANPTKWSNTLKQLLSNSRRIVWVWLTILWGWRLKG